MRVSHRPKTSYVVADAVRKPGDHKGRRTVLYGRECWRTLNPFRIAETIDQDGCRHPGPVAIGISFRAPHSDHEPS